MSVTTPVSYSGSSTMMFNALKNELETLVSKTDWFRTRIEDEIATRKAQEEQRTVDKIMAAIKQTEIRPLDLHKSSPYVLGQVDPLVRGRTSYCGVDVQLLLSDTPDVYFEGVLGDFQRYGSAQAFSYVHYRDTRGSVNLEGSIVDLCLDHLTFPEGKYLTVLAANEYGQMTILLQVQDFEVVKTSFGVSIDDIVSEAQHEWRGKYYYQGALDGNRPKEQQDVGA